MSGPGAIGRLAFAVAGTALIACGSHAAQGPHVIGRADVEAMVRGLRSQVVRVDRIASKRMTVGELRRAQDVIDLGARPAAPLVAQLSSLGRWPPFFDRLPDH